MSHIVTKQDLAFIQEYERQLHQAKINNCIPVPACMPRLKERLGYPKMFVVRNAEQYKSLKQWVK